MADIDEKLAHKEAEYGTLTRAIAGLLEQHDKLRKDFDKELKEKADEAKLQLDKDLKDKRQELVNLGKNIEKAVKNLEKLTIDTSNGEKTLTEQDKRLVREKSVIEEIVSTLNTEKLSLQAEKSVLLAEKTDIFIEINQKRIELTELEKKIILSTDNESVVRFKLEDTKNEFDFKKAGYDKALEESQKKLNIINSQLEVAGRSLHEVKLEEDNIRQDLADWSMRLDGRESTINGREAKVAQQEKRVFNYSKFTGL